MASSHEKLEIYRAAVWSVGWVYRYCEKLKGHRNTQDQRPQASQAIALKIAEGYGKAANGDRRRSFEIALDSALACTAIQDDLHVCEALSADENNQQKALLDRSESMLTKLGQRGYAVREALGEYRVGQFDTDTD